MSRRRRRTRAWATGVVSPAAASQRSTTSRCGRPRAARPQRLGGRVLGERVAVHERQPVAERQLVRGDLEPEQRRDDHGLGAPVVAARLDLAVGALQALGAEREVGRVLEDAAEEHAQRELGARARLGRVAALAARLEVVAQPAAAREARARRAGSSAAGRAGRRAAR